MSKLPCLDPKVAEHRGDLPDPVSAADAVGLDPVRPEVAAALAAPAGNVPPEDLLDRALRHPREAVAGAVDPVPEG